MIWRILGYTLVLLGFLGLAAGSVANRKAAYREYALHNQEIPNTDTIARETARKHLLSLAVDLGKGQESFVWAGVLMLAGAVVLDIMGRRKSRGTTTQST